MHPELQGGQFGGNHSAMHHVPLCDLHNFVNLQVFGNGVKLDRTLLRPRTDHVGPLKNESIAATASLTAVAGRLLNARAYEWRGLSIAAHGFATTDGMGLGRIEYHVAHEGMAYNALWPMHRCFPPS